MMPVLEIHDLHVSVDGTPILNGVSLTLPRGELHVLMGPNGSGKSSLAFTLLGHPRYTVTGGSVLLNGEPVLTQPTHERARMGLFLAFQHPVAIPGVSVANLSRTASLQMKKAPRVSAKEFRAHLDRVLEELRLDRAFLDRSINDGFSGGEKKLSEILQMTVLGAQCVVLDEPDSGLDVDALKRIARLVNESRTPERSFLIITHYERLLQHIRPDAVHIMLGGRIVRSGSAELVPELERSGYDAFRAGSA